MSELEIIKKDVRQILSILSRSNKVNNWVNGHHLTQLTTWDTGQKIRTAKKNGFVKSKKEKGKARVYDLSTINPEFLKKQS